MKMGFHTNSLHWAGENSLLSIAKWAIENGFRDMEIGPNWKLDKSLFEKVIELGIHPTAFIFCRNILQAEEFRSQIIKRIEFAPAIGIDKIIISSGVNSKAYLESNPLKYDPEESLADSIEALKPIIEKAEKHKVKILFENCPLMGNIMISPYMWERFFSQVDSPYVGLSFDPSHFIWLMMDVYKALEDFMPRIYHVHGKDCELDREKLSKYGILHTHSLAIKATSEGENSIAKTWWRYRLPGLGNLDWSRIIAILEKNNYKGTISIEHEDPVFDGSLDLVKEGIIMAKKHIESFFGR